MKYSVADSVVTFLRHQTHVCLEPLLLVSQPAPWNSDCMLPTWSLVLPAWTLVLPAWTPAALTHATLALAPAALHCRIEGQRP